MAIVKMKRLRVIAMAACREELLGQLQRLGCVEIREPETAGEDWSGLLERESSRLAEAKGALAEVNTALAAMRRYGQVKDGLFVKRRLVTEKEFLGGGLEAQAKTVTQDVGERLRTLSGIQTEMSRLQARRAGLLPWQDLDLPLEAEGTEHVLSRLGTCPAGTDVGALRLELEALPAELLEISADKQQRYLLLLCHRAAEEPVMEVLRAHGFSAAAFPGVTGTAAADLKQTDRQLEELQRRREEAEAAIAESARERDTLRTYADRLTAETARESAAERLLTDGTIVFFEGWAPAERMADVSALLERLVTTYGTMESVLADLAPLCVGGKKTREAWEELNSLCALLKANGLGDNVYLDFSVEGNMDYYSGIAFRGFLKNLSAGVLSGGQYDKMVEKMGKRCGAIGFAIYLNELERLGPAQPAFDTDVLVLYDGTTDLTALTTKLSDLAQQGKRTLARQQAGGDLRAKEILDLRGGAKA